MINYGGVDSNGFRGGEAHSDDARAFNLAYRLQEAKRFNVHFYGNDWATCFARVYAEKCAFFLNIWKEAGAPRPYNFERADLDRWREPADFTALAADTTAPSAQRGFASVRDLAPIGDGT